MFIRRKTSKNAANSRAKSSWFIYTYEFFGVKNIKRMDKKILLQYISSIFKLHLPSPYFSHHEKTCYL